MSCTRETPIMSRRDVERDLGFARCLHARTLRPVYAKRVDYDPRADGLPLYTLGDGSILTPAPGDWLVYYPDTSELEVMGEGRFSETFVLEGDIPEHADRAREKVRAMPGFGELCEAART